MISEIRIKEMRESTAMFPFYFADKMGKAQIANRGYTSEKSIIKTQKKGVFHIF